MSPASKKKAKSTTTAIDPLVRPLVAVTWLDAVGPEDIIDPDDAHLEPCTCITVGFLLKNDARAVSIAGTEDYVDKPKTEYRDVTTIPRGMVTQIVPLTFNGLK